MPLWLKSKRRADAIRQVRSPTNAVFLLEVLGFAVFVPLMMRMRISHIERVLARLGSRRPRPDAPDVVETVRRHVQLARAIGAPFIGSDCLTRGLTLCYFLRRAGVDVALSFGMAKIQGRFTGHCWLVKDGAPFLESEDPLGLYTPVLSVPRTSA